jgi:prevent-host-death family protein
MVTKPRTGTIPAGEFKAKCLAILDEVNKTRRGVIVTKRGKPVARIVPVEDAAAKTSLKGSVVYEADLVSPIGEPWSASS